jgi:V/A-type H+/Na+-transporting ATPase subunit D
MERLAPTRSHLLRSRQRLDQVNRGIDLLTRKRRALAANLFTIATPAIEAQARTNACARSAYSRLLEAAAARGGDELRSLGWPARRLEVELEMVESWGVASARVRRLSPGRRSWPERGQDPSLTGPAAAAATDAFEELLELLLDSASLDLLLRRLALALQRTSRQVNTLERRVAPELREQIERVRALLEEREREDHVRLLHLAGGWLRPGSRR